MSNSDSAGNNNNDSVNAAESPDLSAAANLSGLSGQAAVLHAVLPDSVVSEALNNVQVSRLSDAAVKQRSRNKMQLNQMKNEGGGNDRTWK